MIGIVDYGLGNLASVANMLRRLDVPAVAVSDPDRVAAADKLILPGVGAFDEGMRNLLERGLLAPLQEHVCARGRPLLGLCLGMQLLGKLSEEGERSGLGWLDARTVRFRAEELPGLKVPHMGWADVRSTRAHALFRGLDGGCRFYFVHSYHLTCTDASLVVAEADHGRPFVAAVASENVMGVQFHPEKSHRFGMKLLRNFAEM